MSQEDIEKLKFPIGKFQKPESIGQSQIKQWISDIENLPVELIILAGNLDESQLNFRYRPGGWTIRQVIHHIADSHMNSFIRFKLTLTEENPMIKPYDQDAWAELTDALSAPVGDSLKIIEGIHKRWTVILKNMSMAQFSLTFFHPERKGPQRLDTTLGIYAWHGKHHMAHIKQAQEKGFL